MSKKEAIKRAIKKGDLFKKMFCAFIMATGYSNRSLQTLEIRNKNFRYLKRHYQKYLNNIDYEKAAANGTENENVWICWFQGIENAPPIVQACVKSVYKFMPDKKIHIITSENMDEFVQFPDYITEKWRKGKITNTHLSDILRTELLIRYGGLWIDATTYLTGEIPSYVYSQDLFLFNYFAAFSDITIKYNSWFIYAQQDNRALKCVRDLLYAYWKKENKLKEYFLWHLFVTMTAEKYTEDFEKINYILDDVPLHLGRNMFKKFDGEYWETLKRMTSVHKLTYKREIPEDVSDSYYGKIINDEW